MQAVWKLKIPPRVQFFLWLLSSNRVLTRDNVAKRKEVADPSCLFCAENESVTHLFFHCVAKNVWGCISSWINKSVGTNYESVASLWLANKKYLVTNVITSAVLWVIWKLRNNVCFQGVTWSGMKKVLAVLGRMLRSWFPLLSLEEQEKLEQVVLLVEREASSIPHFGWIQDSSE